MRIRLGLLFVMFVLFVRPVWAVAATREEIAQAIQQLGSQRFSLREKASAFLKSAGRSAEPALRMALGSTDPEIVLRAQAILDEFRWGLYPDTPQPIVELIHRYRGGDDKERQRVLSDLVSKGKAGCAALVKIATAEDDADQRRLLQSFVASHLKQHLPPKLVARDFAGVEELLEIGLATRDGDVPRHFAVLQAWRGRLDEKIVEFQQREKEGDPAAAEVLTDLYRMKGERQSARAAAARSGNADLLESILYEQRDWLALLDRPIPAEDADAAWALGLRGVYAHGAGRSPDRDKAVAELRKFRGGDARSAASALFFNDRPNEAIELLAQGADLAAAFELLTVQGRFREAFDLIERARADGGLSFALEVLEARTLWRLGESERSKAQFARLGRELKEDRKREHGPALLQAEIRVGLKDLAIEHCGWLLGQSRGESARSLLEVVFPKNGAVAEAWWKHFRARHASETPAASLTRISKLLDGGLPAAELLVILNAADQAARKLQGSEYPQWLQILADTCQLVSRDDLARTYLEKRVEVARSADAHLKLAHFLAAKSEWKSASEHYGQAWAEDRQRAVPLYLRGWTLTKIGREQEGRELMDLAHWLPLGNEEERYNLADALLDRDLTEEARREFELLVQLSTLETDALPNALGRLSDLAVARKDFSQAAACMERVALLCLRTHRSFVRTEGYLQGPLLPHLYRLRSLVANGKPHEEIGREIKHLLTVQPADANVPIFVVPELMKQGRRQEASALFTTVFERLRKNCADYPRSAMAHNEVAWLAARCRRDLDQGLQHAKKAVELAPDQPSYADTLAEVYFQRGETDAAIKWSRKCTTLDPKREYFRRQLKRFQAGDPTVEVVE